MYKRTTEIGSITLSKNVIGNIITDAISEMNGKLVLCNSKGKTGMLEIKNMTFVEISGENENPDIKIYVLVRFGTSISLITEMLIDAVKLRVRVVTGISPETVAVVVKGVFSKNIAKRNIEVKK